MKPTKADYAKVKRLLASMNDDEFRYAQIQMNMAHSAKELIKRFKLSRKEFCEMIKISSRKYNSFLNGSFEYSLREMATLEWAWETCEMKKAEKMAQEKAKSKVPQIITS